MWRTSTPRCSATVAMSTSRGVSSARCTVFFGVMRCAPSVGRHTSVRRGRGAGGGGVVVAHVVGVCVRLRRFGRVSSRLSRLSPWTISVWMMSQAASAPTRPSCTAWWTRRRSSSPAHNWRSSARTSWSSSCRGVVCVSSTRCRCRARCWRRSAPVGIERIGADAFPGVGDDGGVDVGGVVEGAQAGGDAASPGMRACRQTRAAAGSTAATRLRAARSRWGCSGWPGWRMWSTRVRGQVKSARSGWAAAQPARSCSALWSRADESHSWSSAANRLIWCLRVGCGRWHGASGSRVVSVNPAAARRERSRVRPGRSREKAREGGAVGSPVRLVR